MYRTLVFPLLIEKREEMTQEDAVLYEERGHIAILTLNRSENRNSMTAEMLDGVAAQVERVKASPHIRCVVITGKGRCFCAGADFKSQIQRADGVKPRQPAEQSFAMYEGFLSVLELEVPVIAAMNGHAVGGGFGLSLLCDLRIANVHAKYGANFARLGLHPGMAISHTLPRLVGVTKAAELLFTGRLFLGDEAEAMGLANYAVPAEEVMPKAMALAEEIAASAPIAVRWTKRALYQELGWDAREAAYRESFLQAATVNTHDAKEGMAALLDKRTPQFKGE